VLYLAGDIANMLPWAISETGNGYDYLVLTATPTSAPHAATETPVPEQKASPTSSSAPESTGTTRPTVCVGQACNDAETVVPTPATGQVKNPLCGGALLIVPFLAGLLWFLKRR